MELKTVLAVHKKLSHSSYSRKVTLSTLNCDGATLTKFIS